MFVYNVSFNRNDPPLEFYALFIDRRKSFYYIGNFVYQLFLFLDLLLCAAAVESAFVMLTIFVTCRLNFILKLFQFIDEKKQCGDGILEWINFTAEIHVDVLRLAIHAREWSAWKVEEFIFQTNFENQRPVPNHFIGSIDWQPGFTDILVVCSPNAFLFYDVIRGCLANWSSFYVLLFGGSVNSESIWPSDWPHFHYLITFSLMHAGQWPSR